MIFLKPEEHHWMDSLNIKKLFKAFPEETIRFVGGCVRNALLGFEVSDIDLATQLKPNEVKKCLENAGIKYLTTGIKHGTITAVIEKNTFEITSLRSDFNTDGRHAEVIFKSNWEVDAQRRDFTINALYANFKGQVFDPTGKGLKDLRPVKISFVGNPENRIREDYLRIIRYFRFLSCYGTKDSVNPETLSVIKANLEGLSRLSPERLWMELKNLLSANSVFHALYLMESTGVLNYILPELKGVSGLKKLEDLERSNTISVDPLLRIMTLIHRDIKKVNTLCDRFRMSSKETKRLQLWSTSQYEIQKDMLNIDIMNFIYKEGHQVFFDRCTYDITSQDEYNKYHDLKLLIKSSQKIKTPIFPVKGRDLKSIGITPGPQMGLMLNALETIWIESGFESTRENLLQFAKGLEY